ncbi:STE/Ste20/YSK kinase [Rhizoctonia solani AG-3 Rhs1AP]|uniref:non-specific serine/threonine protein kinase n=1 Tax=Rhizoctonia solani AG-3 Rhs1AP TaxID=1086054 RepID=X8J995_9AGAM|nr:STE/Ste20/YSK kinase [Rhizoctonia solani AG-3 Rhs1AP]
MNRQILPDPNISVTQQYKKLECIGRGAYGSVHKGVFVPTGEVVALKIINLDGQDDDVEAIQKEVALLSTLRGTDSTNITRYHGCWLEGPHVWIVMDLAEGGSVRTLAKAAPNNSIEERFTGIIMREVLHALAFLHRNNVIHRDLKAANVLISSDGRVMLCDFGVSALLATPHSKRSTFVGTPQWMAPEVILGQPYDTKADIWGLGITLYEMATGAPPHADQDHMRALMLIPKLKPPKLPDSTDASKEMRDFMTLCLREIPGDRLSAEELSKSKWIKSSKGSVSILKELLIRYESWTSKGGVRASLTSPFGALDPDEEYQDFSQPQSWEFETIRATNHTDGGVTTLEQPGVDLAALSNPPRSLRMLFEDASNPGADPFRINQPRPNQGLPAASSTSTISTLASLDSNGSGGNDSNETTATDPNFSFDINPGEDNDRQHILPVPFDPNQGFLPIRRDSTDILTARQANYVFPRSAPPVNLDTVKPALTDPVLNGAESDSSATSFGGSRRNLLHKQSFSGSKGLPRSPRPLTAPDSGTESASDKTPTPGAGLNDVPMSPPRMSYREVRDSKGLANISIPPTSGSDVGVVQLAESPGTADSEASSKAHQREESSHGQGSGSGSSLPSTGGLNPSSNRAPRERPSRAKRNATVGSPTEFRFGGAPPDGGLVPPSHGASRSLDSRGAVANGFSGGQSLGGASVALGARPGGLAPTRPAMLGRQASAMAIMEGASRTALAVPGRNNVGLAPAGTGTVLKDLLKLSPVQPGSLGAGIDMLPPSPGMGSISISPVTKVFSHSPSALQTITTLSDVGNGSPVNGRGYAHSQSNSYSHTSQTTPHLSSNNHLYLDNPELPPLDLGLLVSAQDVHAELARTVDGLMNWLGVVDAGLGEVLGIRDIEESEVGDGLGFELDSESLVGA